MSPTTSAPAIGVVSKKTGVRWIPVIGLEVHCQLKTETKLFCSCRYEFGASPNTLTCPVCTAQPGALPVLNREALALAVRVAGALGADVAARTKFDRKNYFYCDLPKGYQISQYDQPFCTGGGVTLASGKRVRLVRIHLEEDAGKAIHDRGDMTLVDLNRAGVPLIESVTHADMQTSDEAYEYLTALKEILQYVGASDCDMEKGSLRCDVNVSVHPEGEGWRTKVELKNLNSFKNVKDAIEHEIERQIEAYESGDKSKFPVQETRLYDATTQTTRTMRSKEDAHDYRYFPEPDLVPFHLDPAFVEKQRSMLPELPAARRARYQSQFGLSAYDAGVLTSSRALADFFETTVKLSGNPKESANWIANGVLANLSDPAITAKSVDELPFRAHDLAELIELVANQTIHNNVGRTVLRGMFESGKSPRQIVKEQGLEQVSDEGQLESWCREALVGKDKVIADVKAGKTKAVAALMGPVMKASKGSANPQKVQEILLRIIQTEL
ncbi:MAG: Asp-tRNA(Asn)/Glu-tRNA(Gln) amidotransferase subunit GatB [Planctomycetes bacterium]|nr:Asp-tRNA(Asn)/Glu-tRNA(Gln) amidotransferase subunit GatB [Planctomycetota bacterium]